MFEPQLEILAGNAK